MLVLALDTTGPRCSVALTRDGEILAQKTKRMTRGQAEALAPMVMALMEAAGVGPGDIDRLAVCTGPGSFTGLRIALSYAKGFALPRKLPIVGVDALRIARAAHADSRTHSLWGYAVDVRRGEFMAVVHSHDEIVEGPRLMSLEEMQRIADDLQIGFADASKVDIATLARMAAALDPADYPAVPLYARAPDAKLPGGVSL